MNRVVGLLQSSIGQKLLMAVTGFGLMGFLVVHMIGNLYVFAGRELLNDYALWLQEHPLLWPARIGLLAVFALHVWLGISLARKNRKARPERYSHRLEEPASTRISRSMALTGLVVLAFLIYHLAHFTFGAIEPEAYAMVDAKGRHDVYGMVVAGFQVEWIIATYIVAMLLLGLHLVHAGQSFLQTLGIRYEHGNVLVKALGLGLVALIIVGNIAIPVLVYLGYAGPESLMPERVTAGGTLP